MDMGERVEFMGVVERRGGAGAGEAGLADNGGELFADHLCNDKDHDGSDESAAEEQVEQRVSGCSDWRENEESFHDERGL